jgi:hypothetical protein
MKEDRCARAQFRAAGELVGYPERFGGDGMGAESKESAPEGNAVKNIHEASGILGKGG